MGYNIAATFLKLLRDLGLVAQAGFVPSLRMSESTSIKFGIRFERAKASSISGGASV